MKKKIKANKIILITLGVALTVGAGGGAYFLSTNAIKQKYEAELKKTQDLAFTYRRSAYIALDTIKVGSTISPDNVAPVDIQSEIPSEQFITAADLGKIALVEIPAEVPVLQNMCTATNLPFGLREFETSLVDLSSNLGSNDFVDVRIVFPNGEDYVVLSKKQLKNVAIEADNCFFWLTEEEILLLTSAFLDSSQVDGTKVYTTKYLHPSIQEASVVDYPLNKYATVLTGITPNVTNPISTASEELRDKFEKRLKDFLGEDFEFGTGMTWGTSEVPVSATEIPVEGEEVPFDDTEAQASEGDYGYFEYEGKTTQVVGEEVIENGGE